VQGVPELVARELAERLEQRDVEVAPDDARGYEHALGRLAEALDAPADQAAHALGKLEVLFGEARLATCRAAEHALRLREIAQGVLDKKWVAFGCGLNADELDRGERRLRQARHDPLDVVVRQPAQSDALGPAPPQQARERGREWPARVELGVPVRSEHHHPA